MLRYCAWCGTYLGVTEGRGYQIRRNICEIDTSGICPPCRDKVVAGDRKETRPRL